MRAITTTLALSLLPVCALADAPVALGPNNGVYNDWTAASYGTGKSKICYAFTVAQKSSPGIPGRGTVMLTVTERPGSPDEVTISSGYKFPKDAKVNLTIGNTNIPFYTQDSTAFTTQGKDAVAAFKAGVTAQASATGPKGQDVTDSFSLSGFTDSYNAISKACP